MNDEGDDVFPVLWSEYVHHGNMEWNMASFTTRKSRKAWKDAHVEEHNNHGWFSLFSVSQNNDKQDNLSKVKKQTPQKR